MSDRDDAPAGYGPPDDAMTYDETGEDVNRGRMVLALAVVMVLAAVSILYVVFQHGLRKGGRDGTPTIVAASGPEKAKPADPGGLEVPDQDKTVFDRVSGEESKRIEKLLPEPEEPIDIAGLRTSSEEAEKADAAGVEAAKEESILAPVEGPATRGSDKPKEKPAPKEEVVKKPDPKVEPETEVVKEAESIGDLIDSLPADTSNDIGTAVADVDRSAVNTASGAIPSATSGAYVVQIASVPEAGAATKVWETLLRKNRDILSTKRPDIQMADLGARGIYYRVRIGPFDSKEAAQSLCNTLKSRGQDCLLRKTE